MRKLNKINEKLNDCEDVEVVCVCGVPLVKMSPMSAYNSTQVVCDRCNTDCSREEVIYHCPAERSPHHPCGYDVCLRCASSDRKMSSCSLPKREELEKKEAVVVEKMPSVEEVRQVENVKQVENLKQAENVKQDQNKPKSDPFEHFQYAAEARYLTQMGFSDNEKIMSLLVSRQGNLDQVISDLLSL